MAFFGIVAPARTPPAILARLHDALVRAMSLESVRKRLASQEAMVVANSPAEFGAEIRRELKRMRAAVEAARIEVN
jgi:tripartite-type tricarboxylate transporter receptor subunit TctC